MALVKSACKQPVAAIQPPPVLAIPNRWDVEPPPILPLKGGSFLQRCYGLVLGIWSYGCLVVLVSTVAAIPILQFASFGYLLECSARMSRRLPWVECIPGQLVARRIVMAAICIGLSWLPIWYVTDLPYTANLIEPGSSVGQQLRMTARIVSVLWFVWIGWALFRGGRLRDFLWPAPFRFCGSVWRPSTWLEAEDRLWNFVRCIKLPQLFWTGVVASLGALTWLALPATLIIASLSGLPDALRVFLGILGVLMMVYALTRVPYLQIHYARVKKFRAFFDRREVSDAYRSTPWSMLWGTIVLFVFATPLYVLRIEPIPQELNWILTFFFVFFLFPAHLVIGWAWGRAQNKAKHLYWVWRFPAWTIRLIVLLAYIGVLYFARFTSWEGLLVFWLQHTLLPPVPFFVQ